MAGENSQVVSISQLDPLEGELLSGDDSIEITISTRSDGGGPGKKTFRTTLNSVLAIYGRRKDNPNGVTAEQVGSYTIEEITRLLEGKLGVNGIAVNALKLDGSTKEEIIAEARAGTVANSERLGGKTADEYLLSEEFNDSLDSLTVKFNDMTDSLTNDSQ